MWCYLVYSIVPPAQQRCLFLFIAAHLQLQNVVLSSYSIVPPAQQRCLFLFIAAHLQLKNVVLSSL